MLFKDNKRQIFATGLMLAANFSESLAAEDSCQPSQPACKPAVAAAPAPQAAAKH